MTNAEYLGDGVYAHMNDFGQIVLTTGHHEPAQADNVIYLETEVARAFQNWLNRLAATT